MKTLIRAWGGAICSTWSCSRTRAWTCGHPHMGGLTPQACKAPAAIPGGRQAFGKRRNTTHSHKSPFHFGTFWASGPPKDQLWSCPKEQDHREGAFLKWGLMRTREKPIWINHERAKWPESSQNKSEDFKPPPPNQKSPNREGTGIPAC